ncbi:MAG: site-specific integrase [Gemmataceae bacterium]|nr:site-specific integrase [Gemmataceae bacterium]
MRVGCYCGLRVSEIGKLTVGDVVVEGARPHLRLQKGHTKGKKGRRVQLWWDAGTLGDLKAWKAVRASQGATEGEAFVCSVQSNRVGQGLQRAAIRRRFLSACKGLGKDRVATLTIHHGRHTFISHALAGGRSLAEVRDAAGHANVAITSGYLHVAVDEDAAVGDLFGGNR